MYGPLTGGKKKLCGGICLWKGESSSLGGRRGAARRRLCCTAVKRREKEKAALYLSIHSGGQICSSAGHSMFGSQIGLRNLEGTKIYIVETHAFLERTVNIGSEALSWKMRRQFYRRGIFVSKLSCPALSCLAALHGSCLAKQPHLFPSPAQLWWEITKSENHENKMHLRESLMYFPVPSTLTVANTQTASDL